jgi:hypothetical protein
MKKLKNYLKERYNHYFLLSALTYIVPVVIFGDINKYNLIFIPISISVFWMVSNWNILKSNTVKSNIAGLINSAFFGGSLGIFGITVLGISSEESLLKVSIYLGGGICLISIILFNFFIDRYRNKVKKDYDSQFSNDVSRERDLKIKSILGF